MAFLCNTFPADLDTNAVAAGAGDFFRQCGFREVGRAIYRSVPPIYFEALLLDFPVKPGRALWFL